MGWEKLACWRTKVAISLKRVKIEEKLLWMAYRLLFPNTAGSSQPPPKISIAIIPGTDKAMGLQIHSPLKVLKKRERGRIQGLPTCFWISHVISGRGKA